MHSPHAVLSPLAAALLCAGAASAQVTLISQTRITPVIAQNDHGACTGTILCAPLMPNSLPAIWDGGAAWDAATNSMWVSSGGLLGRFDPTCTSTCAPAGAPIGPANVVTGLDVVDSLNELWILDNLGVITRCNRANCPPTVNSTCATPFPQAGFLVTSGIAVDEGRGAVFYSVCDFAAGTTTVYVATLANPCTPFASTVLADLFSNPAICTGVACDWGNSILYWTDSRSTYGLAYNFNNTGPSITFGAQSSCLVASPPGEPYTDLTIRVAAATSSGTSCASGTCPSCPVVHSLRTGPVLGSTLQLGLDQAVPNTFYWCLLGFGGCGTGVSITPLCGPILTPVILGPLGPNLTTNGGPCNGSTTFFWTLPANPAFAGTVMSSQCIGLCGGTSTTMSNCLTWVLQGV